MSDLFKGFEEILDIAKALEEKIETGDIWKELWEDIQIDSRDFAGINFEDPFSPTSNPNTAGSPQLKDVGGLSEVLRELRELVEIPLKRPDLLAKLGLEPTRGVLLVGPPGTGKTLTARALAAELGVNHIAIVGPEVMGKYYGEAEARLRQIFEKAARLAPCLIFIDEIDSLAPDRSKVEGELEKRLVGQLLGLMDGFTHTQNVIVLAAT
ncbi:MAG TPA: AAA family ATPase, partial [Candidatus Caenarcaniphilales bacterium]